MRLDITATYRFDPALLGSALKYWLKASTITGVSDGANIATTDWVDQSPSARGDLSVSNNAVYRQTGGPGGSSAVQCALADSARVKSASFTLAQPFSVFMVCKLGSNVLNATLYSGGDNGTLIIGQAVSGTLVSPGIRAGANAGQVLGISNGAWVLVEGIFNGASSALQISDNPAKTGNASTAGVSGGVTFGGAGGGAAGFFADVTIAEILVCGSLTAQQRLNVRGYLAATHSTVTPKILLGGGNSIMSGGSGGTTAGVNDPLTLAIATLGVNWRGQNWAVSGQTSQQATATIATKEALFTAAANKVLCACLELGNDIFFNALTGAQAYANYLTYFATLPAAYKKIAVTSPKRGNWVGGSGAISAAQKAINNEDANVLVRANWVADGFDALVDIAAYSQFSDPTDTTYYGVDQIHPNPTGSALIGAGLATAAAAL